MQQIEGCVSETAVPVEKLVDNIKSANQRRLQNISELIDFREGAKIAIVGGGPSLKDNLELLRTYKRIIACGSVHDYLVENNIIPEWCMICDADPVVLNYVKLTNLGTKYLVASQCNP